MTTETARTEVAENPLTAPIVDEIVAMGVVETTAARVVGDYVARFAAALHLLSGDLAHVDADVINAPAAGSGADGGGDPAAAMIITMALNRIVRGAGRPEPEFGAVSDWAAAIVRDGRCYRSAV